MPAPKTIKTTPGELLAQLPDGNLPDTIKFGGIIFTVEQVIKISNTIRHGITITVQRLRNDKLAVTTDLMPLGIAMIYEPNGDFDYPKSIRDAMMAAGREQA